MRKTEIPESVKIIGSNIKVIIKEKKLKVRHVAHDADLDIEALRRQAVKKPSFIFKTFQLLASENHIEAI